MTKTRMVGEGNNPMEYLSNDQKDRPNQNAQE